MRYDNLTCSVVVNMRKLVSNFARSWDQWGRHCTDLLEICRQNSGSRILGRPQYSKEQLCPWTQLPSVTEKLGWPSTNGFLVPSVVWGNHQRRVGLKVALPLALPQGESDRDDHYQSSVNLSRPDQRRSHWLPQDLSLGMLVGIQKRQPSTSARSISLLEVDAT